MSEFDQWAIMAIKAFYERDKTGCVHIVEYIESVFKRRPKYWKRFKVDYLVWLKDGV